ncbi:MAG: hypothetical protein V6Z86_06685 [Hyphomicrobiales bacterium]
MVGTALAKRGVLAILVVVAGCAGGEKAQYQQDHMLRSIYETAPVTLQLACANRTALRHGQGGARKVLPIASRRMENDLYVIMLVTSEGRRALCSVDTAGNVLSIVDDETLKSEPASSLEGKNATP